MAAAGAVSPLEIARAVESLYRDRLKPYGRILRKRIAEHASLFGTQEPSDIGVRELRGVCEMCPWLSVQDAEGADWTALLVGQPQNFVDVYSPEDVYPQQLWTEAGRYFETLVGDDMVLPGGRYMCAQVLARRNLGFLVGYSLGQIAHIVQLAISQKKLLGYSSGTVVPYAHSQSMMKDKHAECQRPCPGVVRGKATVASWDTMREHLQELMKTAGADNQHIPLSNIKRLFRAQFGIELSETALGYAKLSELLQDHRLSDLCEVKLQGYGYVLLPVFKTAKRNLISLAEGLRLDESMAQTAPHYALTAPTSVVVSAPPPPPPAQAPLAPPPAQPTAAPPLSAPSPEEPRRGRPQPLCMDEIVSPPSSPKGDDAQWYFGDSCDGASSKHAPLLATTPVRTPFPPTPSPSAAYGMSLPRLLGSVRAVPPGLADARKEAAVVAAQDSTKVRLAPPPAPPVAPAPAMPPPSSPGPGGPPQRGAGAMAGSSAVLRGGRGPCSGRARRAGTIQEQWAFQPLTPSTLDSFGFSVHNTFIHATMPPPTPMKVTSQHRARSLPRNA